MKYEFKVGDKFYGSLIAYRVIDSESYWYILSANSPIEALEQCNVKNEMVMSGDNTNSFCEVL
tara:strand:+ start:675 stop:863 length:189 start_codon:yes stop_codon:yes gene_type:complete